MRRLSILLAMVGLVLLLRFDAASVIGAALAADWWGFPVLLLFQGAIFVLLGIRQCEEVRRL